MGMGPSREWARFPPLSPLRMRMQASPGPSSAGVRLGHPSASPYRHVEPAGHPPEHTVAHVRSARGTEVLLDPVAGFTGTDIAAVAVVASAASDARVGCCEGVGHGIHLRLLSAFRRAFCPRRRLARLSRSATAGRALLSMTSIDEALAPESQHAFISTYAVPQPPSPWPHPAFWLRLVCCRQAGQQPRP